MRLHDYLDYYAREQPDAECIVFGDRTWTYAQVRDTANRIANGLIAGGIAAGDRVAVLAKNCPELVCFYYGAFKAGAVPVPLNYRLAPAEWAFIVNDAEARLLSGEQDAERAARALAAVCGTVVVTMGSRGAVCAGAHGLITQPAPEVPVVDTNGAGDLFTAAWVWADLSGRDVAERLRLAVLYASMSIGVATTREGAATADRLLRAAAAPGATMPAWDAS